MRGAGTGAEAFVLLALLDLAACGPEARDEPPPRPACDLADAACSLTTGSASPGGGGAGGGGAGGGGGGGGEVEGERVTGSVALVDAPTFALGPIYAEPATILAPRAGGGAVAASYGGSFGTAFVLEGVEPGLVGLLVEDETAGASGVLSTHGAALVPSQPPGSPIVLPVVDRAMLSALYAGLSGAPILDDSRAQIAVRFLRDGLPAAGVRLEGAVDADAVAYDEGPGFFSDVAVSTGPAGMLLLANAAASGGGALAVPVRDAEGDPFVASVPQSAGSATLVDVELPP